MKPHRRLATFYIHIYICWPSSFAADNFNCKEQRERTNRTFVVWPRWWRHPPSVKCGGECTSSKWIHELAVIPSCIFHAARFYLLLHPHYYSRYYEVFIMEFRRFLPTQLPAASQKQGLEEMEGQQGFLPMSILYSIWQVYCPRPGIYSQGSQDSGSHGILSKVS